MKEKIQSQKLYVVDNAHMTLLVSLLLPIAEDEKSHRSVMKARNKEFQFSKALTFKVGRS